MLLHAANGLNKYRPDSTLIIQCHSSWKESRVEETFLKIWLALNNLEQLDVLLLVFVKKRKKAYIQKSYHSLLLSDKPNREKNWLENYIKVRPC